MIKHIFKLIWNKKGNNSLMILEILLSFLVLYAVLAYVLYNFSVFNKPLGFETKDRLVVNLDDIEAKDSLEAYNVLTNLNRELSIMDQIKGISFVGGIIPFQGSSWQTGGSGDDGVDIQVRVVIADHNFADIMGVKVTSGRWFEEGEENEAIKTTLVNQNFVDKYYPGQDVLGKIIKLDGEVKIIGVYEDFRYMGEFEQDEVTVFYYQNPTLNSVQSIMLSLQNGTPASYEEDIFSTVATVTKNTSFVIQDLDKERISLAKETWIPVIALLVMCGFLCLNVALGLFGILWYNINKRKPEIGLRRALGAHHSDIRIHFVLEILILTLIGVGIGTFFGIQIPLLNAIDIADVIFYKALLYSALIILFIVMLCALYPSNQASKIAPSIALHED